MYLIVNKVIKMSLNGNWQEDLSNRFISIISDIVKIRRIYGFGRSKRFEVLDNNKQFMIKERSGKVNNRYFFGVGEEAKITFNNDNSYLLLLCGSLSTIVVIPTTLIFSYLSKIPTKKANQWKFNIIESIDNYFLEIPTLTKIDVTKFVNKLNLIFGDDKAIIIQEKLNKKTDYLLENLRKEVDGEEHDEIGIINKEEPDFFKMTTQEQIYHLKNNQIKISKLLKKHNLF